MTEDIKRAGVLRGWPPMVEETIKAGHLRIDLHVGQRRACRIDAKIALHPHVYDQVIEAIFKVLAPYVPPGVNAENPQGPTLLEMERTR